MPGVGVIGMGKRQMLVGFSALEKD